MNSAATLTFDSSGNGSCLYSELIDLHEIGALEITRASFIEFNNDHQEWEVKSMEGEILFSHASRSVCLTWEHENMAH